ncbi:hypothetical protein 2203_scaffold802_00100 [Bacteriophage sp.]|nr:hypothetical protein 2203_scaffold802_00100 [Bacteriophage sp.]
MYWFLRQQEHFWCRVFSQTQPSQSPICTTLAAGNARMAEKAAA